MTEDGLPSDRDALNDRRRVWDEGKTTRDRVYEVAVQLYDPASAAEVADRADCSTDAARNHLEWFAEVGILDRQPGRPLTYRRNESYFEWRRAQELRRSHDDRELLDRLEALTTQVRDYRERYDATHPDDVDALNSADHDRVHEV